MSVTEISFFSKTVIQVKAGDNDARGDKDNENCVLPISDCCSCLVKDCQCERMQFMKNYCL